MNKTHSRRAAAACLVLVFGFIGPRAGAVEALLLQDTHVGSQGLVGISGPEDGIGAFSGRVDLSGGDVFQTGLQDRLVPPAPAAMWPAHILPRGDLPALRLHE